MDNGMFQVKISQIVDHDFAVRTELFGKAIGDLFQ
jgi:hypothetical protein